jgi:hypothetical protein
MDGGGSNNIINEFIINILLNIFIINHYLNKIHFFIKIDIKYI